MVSKTVLPDVRNAALSDNGRWLFHLDADNLGQVHDLATAKPFGKSVRVKQDTQLAAISSDGTRIALVGSDKVLSVWDVQTARRLDNPVRLGSAAKHLAFSPNAQSLLTVFSDQEAQVWDIATGAAVHLAGSVDLVTDSPRFDPTGRRLIATDSPRFDPTGRRLIAIDSAGAAHVWATETGKRLTPPLKHCGPVHAAAFCHNGTQIITISQRGAVSVWTLPEAGKEPPALETRPLANLIAYTQLLVGARIDEHQQWQFLELEELRAAWESVR
jgi:WD40 repeat protein